ncbi:MAG: MFS transporter [Mobilitalea sp.]
MNEQHLKQPNDIKVQIASLAISMLIFTITLVTPALSEISKAFPEVATEQIKLVATIPSLMLVFFSIISGYLSKIISLKKILLISMVFIFIGGILPFFLGGFKFLLFTRVIYGIGYGLAFPLGSSVIVALFTGEKRYKLMGYNGSVGALSGVIFQLIGGVLASYYWRNAFIGFLLILPIALYVYKYLPEIPAMPVIKEKKTKSKYKIFTKTTYILIIVSGIFNMLQISFLTNLSLVIAETKVGTAMDATLVLTMYSVASIIIGILFQKFYKFAKGYTVIASTLIISVSFLILSFADNLYLYILAAILYGIGIGIYIPAYVMAISNSVLISSYLNTAISLYSCVIGIGAFLSPYYFKVVCNMFGLLSVKSDWAIASCLLFAGSIMAIFIIIFNNLKASKISEQMKSSIRPIS